MQTDGRLKRDLVDDLAWDSRVDASSGVRQVNSALVIAPPA